MAERKSSAKKTVIASPAPEVVEKVVKPQAPKAKAAETKAKTVEVKETSAKRS